jgi:hypothetical protein
MRSAYRRLRRVTRTGGRLVGQLAQDFRGGRLEGTRTGRFGPLAPSQGGRAEPLAPPPTVFLHGSGEGPRVFWPAFPPAGYLGQLDGAFQKRLAAERSVIERSDCNFYHTFELPNGEVIEGAWDMRGDEASYLGGASLSGQRVLELGPASGYWSFYLERDGADVVAFDSGWDRCADLLPRPGVDTAWAQMDFMHFIGTVQNSWWYMHRAYGSSVPAVYGSIYEIPADLGTFDAAFFGAILLHLRDPFAALSAVADHVSGRIIVTDTNAEPGSDPQENVMRFAPYPMSTPNHWWTISPGAVVSMLDRLGFSDAEVTFHDHLHHMAHDMTQPPVAVRMYTVSARRP